MADQTMHQRESLLTVISYNMHGFNQEILALNNVSAVNCFDVIFIQEHWLAADLLFSFDQFKERYNIFHGVSSIEASLRAGILRGRPHGGILHLY